MQARCTYLAIAAVPAYRQAFYYNALIVSYTIRTSDSCVTQFQPVRCCQFRLAVTIGFAFGDSVFHENIAVQFVGLFHLPVEGTGGCEEGFD